MIFHGMNKKRCGRRQKGSVLLSTLFIVIAVTTISMGYLYRADMTLASGRNLELRNQADYLAWSGLEYARALIQNDPNIADPNNLGPVVCTLLDSGTNFQCDLYIQSPEAHKYSVTCDAYYLSGTDAKARSNLSAQVVYAIADGKTTFASIVRPTE